MLFMKKDKPVFSSEQCQNILHIIFLSYRTWKGRKFHFQMEMFHGFSEAHKMELFSYCLFRAYQKLHPMYCLNAAKRKFAWFNSLCSPWVWCQIPNDVSKTVLCKQIVEKSSASIIQHFSPLFSFLPQNFCNIR